MGSVNIVFLTKIRLGSASWTDLGSILGRVWAGFGKVWGGFWKDFEKNLDEN